MEVEFNYAISLSDLLTQEEFNKNDPESEAICLQAIGFDITRPYELCESVTHRNLRNQVVTCPIYRGFINVEFAKKHKLMNGAEVIIHEVNDEMVKDLKKLSSGV